MVQDRKKNMEPGNKSRLCTNIKSCGYRAGCVAALVAAEEAELQFGGYCLPGTDVLITLNNRIQIGCGNFFGTIWSSALGERVKLGRSL